MRLAYAVRYFQVVGVVPPLLVGGFVIAVGAAVIRLTGDPSSAVEALTPVLLLQLFVASSGFRSPARRGYYDLLLTSGTPRWKIAIAHCLVSIGPGIVSWVCVGLRQAWVGVHIRHVRRRTRVVTQCVGQRGLFLAPRSDCRVAPHDDDSSRDPPCLSGAPSGRGCRWPGTIPDDRARSRGDCAVCDGRCRNRVRGDTA